MSLKTKKTILDNQSEKITDFGKWQKWQNMFNRIRINKTIQSSSHSRQQSPENYLSELLIRSQKGQNSSLFLDQINKLIALDEDRKQLLSICNQKFALPFSQTFLQSSYEELVRIDFGSYAEIFRGYDKRTGQLIVFKLIRVISQQIKDRIRGPEFHAILKIKDICSEFRNSSALSDLNNKTISKSGKIYETHCFPAVFHKYLVEGDIPEYFLSEQISDKLIPIRNEPFEEFVNIPREHAIIVMSYEGQPLWKYIKNRRVNASQLLSVIKQITFGLGIAEAVYEFEHRDLHISNLLLKSTKKAKINFIYRSVIYTIDSFGYEAIIIDNTFSRIKIDDKIYYKDMTDILRFDKSDQKLTSQDRVYKWMTELTQNEWQNFTPKTNIYWLKYLYKLVLNSPIIRECDDKQPKDTVCKMISKIEKCESLQQFINQYFLKLL